MPKVSIIIPCYNYGNLILETINSILNQSLQDWEAIIVDDGSTDNTFTVCKDINDPRVKIIRQDNLGISVARNTGINKSYGDFLQFLDADDLIQHDKLKIQSEYLDDHPEVDVVYGEVRYFYSDNPENLTKYDSQPDGISGSGIHIQKRLLQVCH